MSESVRRIPSNGATNSWLVFRMTRAIPGVADYARATKAEVVLNGNTLVPTPALTLSVCGGGGTERGLLGFAVDRDFTVATVAFYLLGGIGAGLCQWAAAPLSGIPTVGASGAIAAVMGGYLLLFPRNRVYVLTYGGVATVPAVLMLGLWILMQFVNGFGSIATTPETGGGGVAYLAHIGGFIAGMILAPLSRVGMMATNRPCR